MKKRKLKKWVKELIVNGGTLLAIVIMANVGLFDISNKVNILLISVLVFFNFMASALIESEVL